jgi:hypothetical protein
MAQLAAIHPARAVPLAAPPEPSAPCTVDAIACSADSPSAL